MKIHDGQDREATPDEIASIEQVQADRALDEQNEKAKWLALGSAHAKLAALGLTDQEIDALVKR